MRFQDRKHAGQVLAEKVGHYRDRDDVIVLALPRGGVPVGFELARAVPGFFAGERWRSARASCR